MQVAKEQKKNFHKSDSLNREQTIMQYLPHVKRIVQRIAVHLPQSVEIDDLLNVGVIGLIQAIERYDPTRDNKFMTFAAFRIRGAVLSELRSRDYISRTNRRKVRELEKTYLKLEQKKGGDVEDHEVIKEMGINVEQFHKIKQMSNVAIISLEEMGYSSDKKKDSLSEMFINNQDEDALNMTGIKEVKTAIARTIEELPEKEKMVISLYYMDELTMKETGKVLGITESRVSQLHSKAITRLRAKLRRKKLLTEYKN
ncbi:MAG: FliA/WhiG family RNA polymerase sigma factor [Desulfobacterales bacterium]|nr:FliA/WhiG family RNA polymerase sigma factor [Deltaproteobacteria bacterium]NNL42298.1 FliA/WhiG family RNA polymerase sigma factor [Desulfobacterales bacterium]